ncbi:GTPase IMAP family member 8 isoform X2 [Dunckerocampus dactyliophorus]|uniref:GTPase IMAP family member 8 isoform X2 n=1 Tax=Dunckerocampus dactyliophorus TaxID=161453 RepID=UPI0024068EC1|nr:GTPase IMAP family member 8 isoform X2 [Dunckerocampus dactyliophorus]
MASSEMTAVEGWCPSQLKIVLLGGRNSGKSSLGNLLLGKEEFATKERTSCSRRVSLVSRCWLMVVDTPGWWCDFTAEETTRLVRREIQASVPLCSPGPHVFLIAVKSSSDFTERRRRALEEHVGLLGERVWSHCLVVFTSTDKGAQEVPEGVAVRWLMSKCGQRCLSLSGGHEASELVENIQTLVAENGNRVFELTESVCRNIVEEKTRVEEAAHARLLMMKTQRSMMKERVRPLTDVRIVLLGAKGSGKTSALNTILGREDRSFGRTSSCAVGRGVVFGRQVTVVDTPGWWMNYFSDETAIFDRRQIQLSPSLCPPGPHAFLLVIRVDRAFSETYRRAVKEHLELLGGNIWSRVMVLFSFGDWLGGATTERHIESEGEPLRWLVHRCGNRYHVLNSRTRGDGFQVRELVGKIEEMVAACGGRHHKVDRTDVDELERTMSAEATRAKDRRMRKERQRRAAGMQLEKRRPLTEVTLLLVSGKKTGKSCCGNTILDRDCFPAHRHTTSCAMERGRIGDRAVTVLDTPAGFCVTSDFLRTSCAVLLVVNASSSFSESQGAALEAQLKGGGDSAWRRALVLFSHGDWLGDTGIEQRIESEGAALRRLVEKCGNRYHVMDNKRSEDGGQVVQLVTQVEEMLAASHHMTRSSTAHGDTLCRKDVRLMPSGGQQLSHDVSHAADETQAVLLDTRRERGQTDVAMWNRENTTSCLVAMPGAGADRLRAGSGQRLTVNVPGWLHTPMMLLVLPHTHLGMLPGGNTSLERSLCSHRHLQWDHASLEELEAFIDTYFDLLWEQITAPPQPCHSAPTVHSDPGVGGELLSSIDRKLSKLDLLEEIRVDLAEVRRSLELSWTIIQDLRRKSKHNNSSQY